MSVGRIVATCLFLLGPHLFVSSRGLVGAQSAAVPAYRLVLHNRYVQVFDLKLGPDRQAPIHDNSNDLLWVSLDNGILHFEARDGTMREFQFEAGDARLFRRYDVASLRNKTAGMVHSVIVELPRLGRGGCGCWTDVERVVCGCARAGRLPRFWALAIEGATLAETTLEPGQTLQEANDRDDTLLIAIRPLEMQHEMNAGKAWEWEPSNPVRIELEAGGVEWLPQGKHHLINVGDKPARFVTIEF